MKSTFLKVMGILLIVFGAIQIVTGLMSMPTYAWLGWTHIGFVALVQAVIELVAGIMGVMYSANQRKAAGCIVWALLIIILLIVQVVMVNVAMSDWYALAGAFGADMSGTGINWFAFVPPIIYLIAAFLFVRKK